MRYFIYKDSEVAGPFAPEELEQSGISADALVCPEGASGRFDNDWMSAGDVPELARARRGASAVTALLDEPIFGERSGFERLELDTAGVPAESGEGEGWLADLMDDAAFRQRWGELLPKPAEDAEALAQARINDLTSQLEALKSRIAELETYKAARVAAAAAAPPVFTPPPPQALPPLPEAKAAAAPPSAVPAEVSAPSVGEPPPGPEISIARPAAVPEGESAPEKPRSDFEKQGAKFTFKGKGKPAAAGGPRPFKFAPSKDFRVVEKVSPPAEPPPVPTAPPSGLAAPAPVYEWNPPSQQSAPAGLPPAASAPMPSPGLPEIDAGPALPAAPPPPTSPPSLSLTPPAAGAPSLEAPGLAAPPLTIQAIPVPAAFSPAAPAPLSAPPPPAPTPAPAAFNPPATFTPAGAPPMTMMFGAASGAPAGVPPMEPPPVPQMPAFGALTPSRANEGVNTPQPPAADDVVARLAKPAAAPTTDKKPPRKKSPVMLIVGGVGLLALTALLVVFLRDRRGLKSMVAMGSDQKPIGSAVEETPAPAPAPAPKPVASPATTPVAPPTAGPTGGDSIPDAGKTAVDLVKSYPLMGDRGTVGQWLTYSYNADGQSKEDWNAGAVDATTYAVEYKVQPRPASKSKETISLLFEADTARKLVLGKNQAAKDLLTGGQQEAPKPKKALKPVYKKRIKKPAAPAVPQKMEQLPLPSDAELAPPADENASFKSDTVE